MRGVLIVRTLLAVLAVAGGASTASAAAAVPLVLPPMTQLGPDLTRGANSTSAAVNASGVGVLAWSRFPTREPGTPERQTATVAFRTPAGVWSAPQSLSTPGQDAAEVQVALDAAGTATIAWTETSTGMDQTVHVVRVTAAGEVARQTFTPIKGGARELRLAVNDSGAAVLAWVGFSPCASDSDGCGGFPGTGNIFLATRSGSVRPFGEPELLSEETARYRAGLTAAIGSGGDVAVAWEDGSRSALSLKVRQRPAGGAFGAAAELTSIGVYSASPAVAVTPTGSAIVTWWESGSMRATPFSAAGVAGTTQSLPGRYVGPFSFGPAALGTDAAGRITAAWVANDGLWVATADPAGTFGAGAIVDAFARAEDPSTPNIAVDPGGTVLLAWRSASGFSATWKLAGEAGFSAPTVLNAADVRRPIAAALANGHVLIAGWISPANEKAQLFVTAGVPSVVQAENAPKPAADTTAPRIKLVSARVVTVKAKGKKGGTSTRRTLQVVANSSEPVTLTITITKQRPGVRRGARCVAASVGKRTPKSRRCTRTITLGAPSKHNLAAGAAPISLGAAPPRGTYRVVATGTDAAGNASAPVSRRLVVR